MIFRREVWLSPPTAPVVTDEMISKNIMFELIVT
jgi:hypothetical protein